MTLDTTAIDAAARLLVEVRRAGRTLAELPEALRPSTISEAYRIQDAVRVMLGESVAGWKAGATAKGVQEKFGIDGPFCGPFFVPTVLDSPAASPARLYRHRAIESEFAFRFARTLAPRAEPYQRDEVLAAVDALVPAIEIVSPRFEDLLFGRVATAIADCALNAAFVFGRPVSGWSPGTLPDHPVCLTVDGRVVARGTGANVLGDPITALVWTVETLRRRGIALAAGQIISTGTTTGIVHLEPGQVAIADFGSFGDVRMTFVG